MSYHYNAEADPDGVGAYYTACDDACTDPGNWTHTRVTDVTDWSGTLEWEMLERPVLTFTPDGAPRMLAAMLPLGILRFPGLFYVACDADCDQVSNWSKTQIGNSDDVNGDWDMAIDPSGRPYVALAYWWGAAPRIGYCDDACHDPFNWQFGEGPDMEVQEPDLELDNQSRPRIAYKARVYDATGNNGKNSVYYFWCNSVCRSAQPQWQDVLVETQDHMVAEWAQNLPVACTSGEWYQFIPTLALSPTGTARIAVDVGHSAPCEYAAAAGEWIAGEEFSYNTVWRAARLATFPQPTTHNHRVRVGRWTISDNTPVGWLRLPRRRIVYTKP